MRAKAGRRAKFPQVSGMSLSRGSSTNGRCSTDVVIFSDHTGPFQERLDRFKHRGGLGMQNWLSCDQYHVPARLDVWEGTSNGFPKQPLRPVPSGRQTE